MSDSFDSRIMDRIDMSSAAPFNSASLNKYEYLNECSTLDLKEGHHRSMEKSRKKDVRFNGGHEIFYSSCFGCHKTRTGDSAIKIQYRSDRYSITINSMDGNPYSISFNDAILKFCSLSILPTEIIKVHTCIYDIIMFTRECMCNSRLPPHKKTCMFRQDEVEVWNNQSTIRVTRRCNIFFISQIHNEKNKQIHKSIGLPQQLVVINQPQQDDIITVHRNDAKVFTRLMLKANRVVRMQWEILAQQNAVASFVKKRCESQVYSREELYFITLDCFFALDSAPEHRLPAWYVIREFLEAYLCEYYCMYAEETRSCEFCDQTRLKCTCNHCIANPNQIRDRAPADRIWRIHCDVISFP